MPLYYIRSFGQALPFTTPFAVAGVRRDSANRGAAWATTSGALHALLPRHPGNCPCVCQVERQTMEYLTGHQVHLHRAVNPSWDSLFATLLQIDRQTEEKIADFTQKAALRISGCLG